MKNSKLFAILEIKLYSDDDAGLFLISCDDFSTLENSPIKRLFIKKKPIKTVRFEN